MFRNFILSAILCTSTPALALGGWTDVDEISQWNDDTLLWAQDVHPNTPSVVTIEAVAPSPPEELWCIDPEVEEDCEIWEDLLSIWLHQFLGIDENEALPVNLPLYPKLCPSTCEVF